MTDGLDALQARVAPRGDRPPKVPAVPSRHPRPPAALPPAEESSVSAQEPVRASAHAPERAPATSPAAAKPVRVARLPVTPEQDRWLRTVCAAALADGTRLSEATLLRVALDRLRAGGATWPQLRDAVLAETRQRSRRA